MDRVGRRLGHWNNVLDCGRLPWNKPRFVYRYDTEIPSHYDWTNDTNKLRYSSTHAFIMGLFTKYLSLSLKRGSNEISRNMLTKIIMDSLNQHVANTYKYLRKSSRDVNANVLEDKEGKKKASVFIKVIFSLNPQISHLYIEKDVLTE